MLSSLHYADHPFTRPTRSFSTACEVLNRLLLTHDKLMHPEGDPSYGN